MVWIRRVIPGSANRRIIGLHLVSKMKPLEDDIEYQIRQMITNSIHLPGFTLRAVLGSIVRPIRRGSQRKEKYEMEIPSNACLVKTWKLLNSERVGRRGGWQWEGFFDDMDHIEFRHYCEKITKQFHAEWTAKESVEKFVDFSYYGGRCLRVELSSMSESSRSEAQKHSHRTVFIPGHSMVRIQIEAPGTVVDTRYLRENQFPVLAQYRMTKTHSFSDLWKVGFTQMVSFRHPPVGLDIWDFIDAFVQKGTHKTFEISLEVNAEILKAEYVLQSAGRPNCFDKLVSEFVENSRFLSECHSLWSPEELNKFYARRSKSGNDGKKR